jgi:hypothetical protein
MTLTPRRPATALTLRLHAGSVAAGRVVATARLAALRRATIVDLRGASRLRPGPYALEVTGRDDRGRAASAAFRITVRR